MAAIPKINHQKFSVFGLIFKFLFQAMHDNMCKRFPQDDCNVEIYLSDPTKVKVYKGFFLCILAYLRPGSSQWILAKALTLPAFFYHYVITW